MGQKSNVQTIRKNLYKDLSFSNHISVEKSFFLRGLEYSKFLDKFLIKKNILILFKTFNIVNNRIQLNFNLFFRTSRLLNLKKNKIHLTKSSMCNKNSRKLSVFFLKQFEFLRCNFVYLNFKILNSELNYNNLSKTYSHFSRFVNILFLRKFNLFIDFLKIYVLFYNQKVFVCTFLYILCQIFKNLPKRKHNRFLFFLKFVFNTLVDSSFIKLSKTQNVIKGIKFIIQGKLQGKTRASSSCITVGAIPIQGISKNIEFAKLHVYTIYGAFGFRIWIYRDSID